MRKWARLLYQPGIPLYGDTRITGSKEHVAISREAACEGIVLLKNNGTLPLSGKEKVALIGKASVDYVKGGGGSGDVFCKYIHSLYDGIKLKNISVYEPLIRFYKDELDKQYKDGLAPGMTKEVKIPDNLLEGAKSFTDTAIVVLNRFSGEGWDRSSIECNNEYNPWPSETSMPKVSGQIFPDGDFYLTSEEKEMVDTACACFEKVIVVLNIGGIIDLRWAKENPKIDAVLFIGQGGMEGGDAAADVIFGKVNPSGRLADTFAGTLEDYPSTEKFNESFDYVDYNEDIYVGYRYFETIPDADKKVVYPFGYGLSYTDFNIKVVGAAYSDEEIVFTIKVTNT
ncbi:Glycosyl hydrolase family 3 C-terminal domain-containing protein [Butyrivibrio proteoclasticus]|uniref:Glycosyl hydrolase family 3 C-terminal domain-containing protein n=1 Tax=Butyrivibrio proteoclasticus TaxID=43305 RepID=A0A1I5XX93_9FIRM|nr:glycoside hydrolase family 3 C-terminal domain-containing protein [Butyrivibrio proteoclasticus]SFQ36602.1 Glycosyl hydrolase family 3 C-terminal domain-containing protein [Butyrivibrio proteoclasticus]